MDLAAQFNPFVSPQLEDPYPVYARARREAPVFFSPLLQMWIVSRHKDIVPVLRDPATFSSADMLKNTSEPAPEALEVLRAGGYARMPLTVDNSPPSHTRIRGAVRQAFTPRRNAVLTAIVTGLLDELIGGFERDGEADLVAQLAMPLALQTIMRLLGVPKEDMARLKAWGDDWAAFIWAPLPREGQVRCAEGMVAYLRYGMAFVEDRRRSPADDLTSDLIRQQDDGDPGALSDAEIAYMMNDLVFAGHETTMHGIGNCLKTLLGRPDELPVDALRDRSELVPDAVAELLRLDTPSQLLMRTATRATQVGGVDIAAGERVAVLLGSANHDETVFPEPERLDTGRANLERTLTFGQGIHACLGLNLALLEIRLALTALSRRLAGLRLAPDQTFAYQPNLIFRGVKSLRVRWDA